MHRTVIISTHIFRILTGKPVIFFFSKLQSFFLWPPLDEILENYTEILLKTIYITGILSTHIFKIIVGKPV